MNKNVCIVDYMYNLDFYDVTYISETLILPISFSFVYGLYAFMIFFKHMFMVNLFIYIEFTLINGMVSPTELLNYTPKKIRGYRFGNIFLVFFVLLFTCVPLIVFILYMGFWYISLFRE